MNSRLRLIILISLAGAGIALGVTVAAKDRSSAPSASISAPNQTIPDTKQTDLYRRIRAALELFPAIDTHDHLRPFDEIPGRMQTELGTGMTLAGLWQTSYFNWVHNSSSFEQGKSFDAWWQHAQHDFDNARATGIYRAMLPAFRDLYGVDFDEITSEQAAALNRQIFDHYHDSRWIEEVVTERSNIELMLIDAYWSPFDFAREYKFGVHVFNVNTLIQGFHPAQCPDARMSPYAYAEKVGQKVDTFDDYLALVERIFQDASTAGAACPKCTLAYRRTLDFAKAKKEDAEKAFGRRAEELSPAEIKAFEDFLFGKVCELCAKYEMPFQVHTGHARLQGSNPLLLADAIEAHPTTTFILFHGGFPWTAETGMIAARYSRNVRIDFNWLPILSYSAAKRALGEWLELMPSNHLMWGSDSASAEGIYGATQITRDCIAEVLAEKVARGQLHEQHALAIGKQILRDNALETFPKLRRRLWKKG